ncbi:hypothetical protein N2152v2_002388 [Parachlorella kessleri]
MTRLSRLPAYFVFPEGQLDVAAAANGLAASSVLASSQHAVVFLDQPLLHLLPQVRSQLAAQLAQRGVSTPLTFAVVPSQHLEPSREPPPTAAAAAPAATAENCTAVAPVVPHDGATATSSKCCGFGVGHQHEVAAVSPEQPEAGGLCMRGGSSCCQGAQIPCCRSEGQQQEAVGAAVGGSSSSSSSSIPGPAGANPASSRQPDAAPDSSHGSGDSLAGYHWQLQEGTSTSDCCLVWVGSVEAPALLQLQMTFNSCQWAVFDSQGPPAGLQEGLPLQVSRALRRRYFLVEKARVANIVGILVGTLGVAGYRDAIQSLRQAAQRAGKKTYTLLMGKPSPAKLANFPEIEVFVMVADPQGQILDSKEYMSPIITPYEAMLAFSPDSEWEERRYRLDFDGVLKAREAQPVEPGTEGHFSLVDGSFHAAEGSEPNSSCADQVGDAGKALALRAQEALQITAAPGGRSDLVQAKSAADYFLHKRTYAGLEAPLVGAEEKAVEKAALGRSGRAVSYSKEGSIDGNVK